VLGGLQVVLNFLVLFRIGLHTYINHITSVGMSLVAGTLLRVVGYDGFVHLRVGESLGLQGLAEHALLLVVGQFLVAGALQRGSAPGSSSTGHWGRAPRGC